MTRKRWKLAALLLLAGLGTWLVLTWYTEKGERTAITEQDLIQARRRLGAAPILVDTQPKPVPLTSAIRVAVGSLGLRDSEQNGQVSDLLLARLRNAQGVELIERQALEPVLKELGLNLSGLVRARDAIRAGRLLRADWFLLGTPLQLNTNNLVVVRVVDARTGVFQDTGVFATANGLEKMADQLSAFLLQCRQRVAAGQAPVYLAIGAFNDLSLNNRLADFPAQLRSYLAAAYRGSDITLLERDYVETLLQEIRLDSAGLTENNGTNGAVMQTAFWLLEGDYQSDNTEVELELHLRRIFGLSKTVPPIRQPAGESLFNQVKSALDQEIRQQKGAVVLSRVSETRAQMLRGKDLTHFDLWNSWGEPYQQFTGQEARLEQRRLQEAIRAFQAALLLEPTNREAKVYLAECYCRPLVGRREEGRNLFREVYEEPPLDDWHQAAARRLIASFRWGSPEERLQWFSRAEQQSGNPHAQTFYHAEAAAAREQIQQRQGAAQAQPDTLAERKLLADIRSGLAQLEGKSGTMANDFGMDDYVGFFRPDKGRGGRKLAELLPHLTNDFPKLAPHLTAAALKYQTETNNLVLPRFQRELAACREHPENVLVLWQFCSLARYGAYDWCLEHGHPELAAQILDVVKQCARADRGVTFDDEDHLAQAFAYLQAQDWAKALPIFETYSNLPVAMTRGSGPWGRCSEPVLTASEAANCRRKLGLPVSLDPRQFELETNLVAFKGAFAFATDSDGLWVAANDQLLHLDFALRTNFSATLPCSDSFAVNCLLVGTSNVWIGTDGAGLMEFDKQTRKTVRYGEKEGLLSDVVSGLCLGEDTLWIGYGVKNGPYGIYVSRKQAGGLGAYDLRERRFRAFTPSLVEAGESGRDPFAAAPAGPPGRTVAAVVLGPDKDVWVSTWPLRRLRVASNAWDSFPEVGYPRALQANAKYLVVGAFAPPAGRVQRGPLGIKMMDFAGHQWRAFKEFGPLPGGMVSALAFEGENLWVAGMGYLAKINPKRNELLHYGYLRAFAVDQIQVGGGYIWARCDRNLHRARLPAR